MRPELLNKLTNLTFYGFYDPSKEMVTVHFFNEKNDKADIIAFLKNDMTWDIREIESEESSLYENSEIVTIKHNRLSIESPGDSFDDFIRLGLEKLGRETYGEDAKLAELDLMFKILENNKYE